MLNEFIKTILVQGYVYSVEECETTNKLKITLFSKNEYLLVYCPIDVQLNGHRYLEVQGEYTIGLDDNQRVLNILTLYKSNPHHFLKKLIINENNLIQGVSDSLIN